MFANGTPLTDTRSQSDARRILHKFATDQLSTRDVLGEITDQLAGFGLSSNDLGVLELILAEALNNIFEHAYEAGTGPVELDLIVTERAVICELRDLGRPMPGGTPPTAELPCPTAETGVPEGGFGWYIIRSLVSELKYERGDGLNFLRMTVPLADHA